MKRSEDNNNFVMFGNYRQYFEMLNAEQNKKLIIMLFDFAETKELNQCDDININLVYKTITDNMLIGSKRRIASVENGKKGGRPPKNTSPKKETSTVNKPKKNKLGEFGNVRLTEEDVKSITEVYGYKFNEAVDILDGYMETSGKKYKNHRAVFKKNNWLYKRVFNVENQNFKDPSYEVPETDGDSIELDFGEF